MATLRTAHTDLLDIVYEESGPADGAVAILLHGFPYDVRAYDEVAEVLAEAGMRVICPYLRGFGATRFRDNATMRSGQQGAIAQDLVDLLDTLQIERAFVAGYDWGGRAACIVAALWPERISGLVTADGYNIQDIANALEPSEPSAEATYWYQYYFHSERGRRGLERNREDLCELLWQMWSPAWEFDHADFVRSAPSLHNPDFVDVVIHSYRHRYGLVPGDPRYDAIEAQLVAQPPIIVPTVVIECGSDGVAGELGPEDRQHFTGEYHYRFLLGSGHNVPQEAPQQFAAAMLSLV